MMTLVSGSQKILLAQRSLVICQRRFNMRESIHRHTEPPKFKKHMLAACIPYYKRVYRSDQETCMGTARKLNKIHPLEKLLIKDMVEDIRKTDYALLIQYNYTNYQVERVQKNTLTKLGAKFHSENNNVYKGAFDALGYYNIENIFIGRNAIATGYIESLPAATQALRKMPTFLLLAGFIDKHLYNVDQIQAIAADSDINLSRAKLLATLNSPSVTLSSYLKRYIEENPEDNKQQK